MSPPSFVELYRSHEGYVSDKWEQYLPVYDAEIGQLVARGQPLTLLEIGVQNGGSLEIWSKLLPPGSEILGIDIDPRCAKLALPKNAGVLIGDASNRGFLDAALGDRTFDIVIDDGSHRSGDIIASFKHLFPRLRPSGKYFIEDLHASYWAEFDGGFRKGGSAIEFLKSLIDALHVDHVPDLDAIDAEERASLVALNRQIARLSFCDSLAVIEKYQKEKTGQFVRTIAGSALEKANPSWQGDLSRWPSPLMFARDETRQELESSSRREAAQLQAELRNAQRALSEAEASRESSLAERDRKTAAVQGQLEKERRKALRLWRALSLVREKNAQLRGKLRAIKSSWSWRLSFPVRRAERAMRRRKAK